MIPFLSLHSHYGMMTCVNQIDTSVMVDNFSYTQGMMYTSGNLDDYKVVRTKSM